MMRLRNYLFTGIAAGSLAIFTPATQAELPVDVRTSANADAQKPAIQQYVTALVGQIRGTDPKLASQAREELTKQVKSNPNAGLQVSASFQLVYTTAVMNEIQPMLKSPDVRDRLSAGVIVQRLADATKLMSLQQATQTLLADESPAVALWGVKSAAALIPTVLNGGFAAQNEKLTAGIVDAVKKHPQSGPIVQDAYRALDITKIQPALPAAGIDKATTAINDILAARVQMYVNGLPADVQADRDPTLYLWNVVNARQPAVMLTSVQNLVNLLSVTSQRLSQTSGDTRDRLQKVAENAAGSLIVIFTNTGNDAPIASLKPFQRIGMMNGPQMADRLANAVTEIRKVPAFKSLKDPPVVQPLAQAAAGN